MVIDQPAITIESVRCEGGAGSWVLLYRGRIVELGRREVDLRLEERIGFRFHPDHQGVDSTDWWCIPKRRFCFSRVEFTAWNGQYRWKQVVKLPQTRVFPANGGLIGVTLTAIQNQCP